LPEYLSLNVIALSGEQEVIRDRVKRWRECNAGLTTFDSKKTFATCDDGMLMIKDVCSIILSEKAYTGRIERMDYIPTIPQLEKLAGVLDFEVDRLFVENNQPTVFTAFRGSKLSDEERAGADHLMEMMLAARQQIMLRKALHHE
jgi:hypothetical protein